MKHSHTIAFLLVLTGCAGNTVKPVTPHGTALGILMPDTTRPAPSPYDEPQYFQTNPNVDILHPKQLQNRAPKTRLERCKENDEWKRYGTLEQCVEEKGDEDRAKLNQ